MTVLLEEETLCISLEIFVQTFFCNVIIYNNENETQILIYSSSSILTNSLAYYYFLHINFLLFRSV